MLRIVGKLTLSHRLHPKVPVLYVFLMLILVCATLVLWWQLSRARELNADLHAEVIKLRGRVRALRL